MSDVELVVLGRKIRGRGVHCLVLRDERASSANDSGVSRVVGKPALYEMDIAHFVPKFLRWVALIIGCFMTKCCPRRFCFARIGEFQHPRQNCFVNGLLQQDFFATTPVPIQQ